MQLVDLQVCACKESKQGKRVVYTWVHKYGFYLEDKEKWMKFKKKRSSTFCYFWKNNRKNLGIDFLIKLFQVCQVRQVHF